MSESEKPKRQQHLKPYQFKKGQSGNPNGGKAHNKEIKKIKNLTEKELIEVGSLVVKGSIAELERIRKDKNSSALGAMIAGVALNAIAKGNSQALDAILNRLIGKVKEKVEINQTSQVDIVYETQWGSASPIGLTNVEKKDNDQ